MTRARIAMLAAATFGSAVSFNAAEAGCCGYSSGGCCGSSYGYAQPQVVYAQPAPMVVQVQPAPIYVQVGQPQVVVQQQPAYEPAMQTYMVNQGPVYSGPGTDYAPNYYQSYAPSRPYPYWRGYRGGYRHAWRHNNYRYSNYRDNYRHANYRMRPQYWRGAVPPRRHP